MAARGRNRKCLPAHCHGTPYFHFHVNDLTQLRCMAEYRDDAETVQFYLKAPLNDSRKSASNIGAKQKNQPLISRINADKKIV